MPTRLTKPFEFTFRFKQTAYPASGRGLRNGMGETLLGKSSAELREFDRHSVETLALLAGAKGKSLELALIDGVLMRSLCAPGVLEPCTFEEFMHSASGGKAWRDSPFAPPVKATDPVAAIVTHAKIRGAVRIRDGAEERAVAKWGADSTEYTEAAAALERLSKLVVVDEMVFVPCDEPVLTTTVQLLHGKRIVAVGWSFSDIGQHDHPLFGRTSIAENHGYMSPEKKMLPHHSLHGVGTFSLDREVDARAFALAMSAAISKGECETGTVCVRELSERFRPLRDDLAEAWKIAVATVYPITTSHGWQQILSLPSDRIAAWARFKGIAERTQGAYDAETAMEALDNLSYALMNGDEYSRGESMFVRMCALALRWRTVEHAFAHAEKMPSEDADAIASLGM